MESEYKIMRRHDDLEEDDENSFGLLIVLGVVILVGSIFAAIALVFECLMFYFFKDVLRTYDRHCIV